MAVLTVRQLTMVLALAGFLGGCGSNPARSSVDGGGASSADLTRALDCRPKAAAALSLADAAADPDLRHVPAESLTVTVDGQTKSLCDLLRDADKPLAMFQLVSVKCYDCMKWVETLNADIAANNLAGGVLPVAILTDTKLTVTDAEVATLKAEVAPNAVWARDLDGSVTSFFSLSDQPGAPVAPETVVMDYAARGFYCDQKGTPATALVEIANRIMELQVGQ